MQHVAQMILFAKVVEAGSFSAAAKALGQTRAAVSKQIASLEARIRVLEDRTAAAAAALGSEGDRD